MTETDRWRTIVQETVIVIVTDGDSDSDWNGYSNKI